MGIIASAFWGVSGTLGQYLFSNKEISVEWLITVRLLISGLTLLLFAYWSNLDIFCVWKNRKNVIQLIFFSIFGMLSIQYTYFAAIKHSNAATATVLQYSGPAMIAIYTIAINKKTPKFSDILPIILAILGAFLLVTHGQLDNLIITPTALFWGLSSALALAIYSLQPRQLLEKYDSILIVG